MGNTDRFSGNSIIQRIFRIQEFGVFLILLGLCVLLAIFRTDAFLSVENLSYVARAFSFIAIMAFGECMVIITAGIDLSIGSVFGLSAVCAAWAMRFGIGPVPPPSCGDLFSDRNDRWSCAWRG